MVMELDQFAQEMAELSKVIPQRIIIGAMQAAAIVAGELATVSNERFNHRTGALARSWRPVLVYVRPGEIATAAYSNLPYADILDRGGTIVPRVRKRLAIPLQKFAVGKWPRDFAPGQLVWFPSKVPGVSYLAEPKKQTATKRKRKGPQDWRDKIKRLMFKLVPSVTIRPRHYIDDAWRQAEPLIAETLPDLILMRM